MISAWWLLVVIPVSVMTGYIMCALLSANDRQGTARNKGEE